MPVALFVIAAIFIVLYITGFIIVIRNLRLF